MIITKKYKKAIVEEGSSLDFLMSSDQHLRFNDQVGLSVYFPLCNPNHTISVPIKDNFRISFNANAYELVLDQAERLPSVTERNGLYSFKTGLMGDIGICGSLIAGIKAYDWEQYAGQVAQWMADRELMLTRARKHPNVDADIGNPLAHN